VSFALQEVRLASLKFDSQADVAAPGSTDEPKFWLLHCTCKPYFLQYKAHNFNSSNKINTYGLTTLTP